MRLAATKLQGEKGKDGFRKTNGNRLIVFGEFRDFSIF